MMAHTVSHSPQTKGLVIHWAARYDLLIQVVTLGRARQLRAPIADLMQVRPGDAVLDVGCGTGDLALILTQRVGSGGTVAGIDASPEMIARARQKAERQGATIDFRLEPAEALSFPDQSFDGVVSSFAFHHLPGDLKRQALASIARVLKPGGQVCIVDFMRRTPMSIDAQHLSELLSAAGFTDITSGRLRFPGLGFLVGSMGFVSARLPAR